MYFLLCTAHLFICYSVLLMFRKVFGVHETKEIYIECRLLALNPACFWGVFPSILSSASELHASGQGIDLDIAITFRFFA